MHHVEEGEIVFFLWQDRNTVVIGRNQNGWRECDVKRLEEDGGLLARRLSGGGAVYHDIGNMNFSFLARRKDYDVDRQLSVIMDGLSPFGIHAEKADGTISKSMGVNSRAMLFIEPEITAITMVHFSFPRT